MSCEKYWSIFKVVTLTTVLGACQGPKIHMFKDSVLSSFPTQKEKKINQTKIVKNNNPQLLSKIVSGSLSEGNDGSDFQSVMKSALNNDPLVSSKRRELEAKKSAVGISEAQKEFQVSSTLYGGIEDVTDSTKGVAVSLNASRVIYDGGMMDAQIASKSFVVEAAKQELRATIDERAYRLGVIWIELEKYETLNRQIESRLTVLDPLIEQLEQVAKAGVGDVTKVTIAQRTVSAIRIEQSNILNGLAQAHLEFTNAFGLVKSKISYDSDFILSLLPREIDETLAEESPLLRAQYAKYQSGLSDIVALQAKNEFNVGFEARAMRPFAGSEYDSDESLGFIAKRVLYTGGMLESEIEEAGSLVEATVEQIKASYREGARTIKTALQSIESMDNAILIARKNAEVTANEIVYLRQQLVIGGSTLDSVLSAEARLYEAESKEINFRAEKHKSNLLVATTLGLTSASFGL